MLNRKPEREPWSLSQRLWVILACLWIISASLGPDILLGEGLLKLRPEDLLTVVMTGLALLKLLVGRVRWNTHLLLRLLRQAGIPKDEWIEKDF